MPLQQMQDLQELNQKTSDNPNDENSPHPDGAQNPDREKPNFWIWTAAALIVFLAISAGIYFWIFG
ncbi:hypothetical protein HY449_03955 [Candidatus Pacearchaeota archaeon]|nr:hypothetical protein [Candidatus Pacearchaeota archaeon]